MYQQISSPKAGLRGAQASPSQTNYQNSMSENSKEIIAQGVFDPRGGHNLSGGFQILRTPQGVTFTTTEDFYFDGAAEPGLSFTLGEIYNSAAAQRTDFLRLPASNNIFGSHHSVEGVFGCDLPGGLDVMAYDRVFLWCHATPFLMGVGIYK